MELWRKREIGTWGESGISKSEIPEMLSRWRAYSVIVIHAKVRK